jgi:hypothetical protein
MLKGSTPLQPAFQSLDFSPAERAGALEQQAIVDMSNSINKAVNTVLTKKQEKDDQEMRMQALAPMLAQSGMAGEPGSSTFNSTLKALSKDADLMGQFKNFQAFQTNRITAQANQAKANADLIEAKAKANEGVAPVIGEGFENSKEYFIPFDRLSEEDKKNPLYEKQGGRVVIGGQIQTSGGPLKVNGKLVPEGSAGYYDDQGNFNVLPNDSQVFMPGSVSVRQTKALEAEGEIKENQNSIRSLEKYLDVREEGPSGLDLLYNQITGNIANLLGMTLTPDQINVKTAKALFEQLKGQNRKAVLGPGVMTEQDAIRLEKALGDFGATSNIEVVRDAIKEILQGKYAAEKSAITRYNSLRRYPGVHDIFSIDYTSLKESTPSSTDSSKNQKVDYTYDPASESLIPVN